LHNRYLSALARFGFTLLAGGLLLKALAGAFPAAGVVSPVGVHYRDSLGSLARESIFTAIAIGARGLAMALPPALAMGLAAGLRPGSRTDRLLTGAAALLAGIPALPLMLSVVCALSLDLQWFGLGGAVHAGLAAAALPWLMLAVRDGVAPLVAGATGVHPARAMTAMLGALLGQAGNIALGALAAGVYLVPDNGLLRLLELSSRMSDPALLYTLLAPAIILVAALHLAGDLLTAMAAAPRRPAGPGRPSRLWTLLAGTLLAAGLAAFAFDAPATANTWLVALGALPVAAAGGAGLALAGPLAVRPAFPSFIAPLIAGLALPVLAGRSFWLQIIAIGLGCAPTLAGPLHRLFASGGADRLPAAGAALLALSQAFAAQVALGVMNAGLPADAPSLGGLIRTALLADPNAQHYGPALAALAAGAGLFLLGFALLDHAPDRFEHAGGQSSAEEGRSGPDKVDDLPLPGPELLDQRGGDPA